RVPQVLRNELLRDAAQERGVADLPRSLRSRRFGADELMPSSVANIHSETGWDALAGELPVVVRVMSSPATLEELAEVVGEPDLVKVRRRLARLVREGVIVQRDDRYEAPARIIDSVRQEGLLTSFGLHLMPTITRLANDPSCG